MQNKIILITGGTSGIGKQTALALAKMGARVIITGRSKSSGEAAVAEIKQASGNSNVDLLLGDLSAQADVHSLAEQFKARYERLDVLINNAGLVEPQRRITEDGVESIFAVNVIAPFLLTHLLMDSLKASPSARVISVTGGDHLPKIDLDNLQSERSFLSLNTYSHAKTSMMAVMYEFAQRTQGSNVSINVCFPGGASTNMTASIRPEMAPTILKLIWPIFKWMIRPDGGKSAEKAARSSIYLASSPEVEGVSGKYFDTNSKMANWPASTLDQETRQLVWKIAERVSHIA